jgi:hypothetical protein
VLKQRGVEPGIAAAFIDGGVADPPILPHGQVDGGAHTTARLRQDERRRRP